MQPPYQPSGNPPALGRNPRFADPDKATTLPPQIEPTMGDVLSLGYVSWSWYAGAADDPSRKPMPGLRGATRIHAGSLERPRFQAQFNLPAPSVSLLARATRQVGELVDFGEWHLQGDAPEFEGSIGAADRSERPGPVELMTVGVGRHFVLIEFNDLRHALDVLEVATLSVPGSPGSELGRRHHLKDDAREIIASDRGVRDPGGAPLLRLRRRATPDLRSTAIPIFAKTTDQRTGQAGDDGAVLGVGAACATMLPSRSS